MSAAVYQKLVGPLRYASHGDFARLGTVRNLRTLMASTLSEVLREGGGDERVNRSLREAVERVDHPSTAVRKSALKDLIAALESAGVPVLPAASVATPSMARSSLARSPEAPSSVAPSSGAAASASPARAPRSRSEATLVEVPRRPKARKAAVGRQESQSEARLLSIAPSSGPLARPVSTSGVRLSPHLLKALQRRKIETLGDVLFLLPRCYEDRRRLKKILELIPGERGVTVATVRHVDESFHGRRRKLFKAVVADETGSIALTYFQGGPWLRSRFPLGKRLVISGELKATGAGREMAHPEVEPAEDLESSSVHHGRIVPIYPGFERHEQKSFRELAFRTSQAHAAALEDPLPQALRTRLGLMGLPEALQRVHFPPAEEPLERLDRHVSAAHQRLAFDELFFLHLGMALKRRNIKVEPGIRFDASPRRLTRAKGIVPFTLTAAQDRVLSEIAQDMGAPEPMNRLLQGDVGSGKTAVAAVSAALALLDGYQVALMAPTEILAAQHHKNLSAMLGTLGFEVSLVTAAGTAKEKRAARQSLESGRVRMAVGTHALVQESACFERLGLVIIDEQHRFGVLQRHALINKGCRPDVLVMTATPIPRTLAMTLYGDLDVSVIDQLPPGRSPVETRAFTERQRSRVYERLTQELQAGRQAYVVFPLVEESEKSDLADATRGAQELQAIFTDRRVGLIHGRLRQEEKDAVMGQFRAGGIDVLVATSVIEVGVDVPNATVMVIEHAERFGLSQLHQLRGRVGRGSAKSYCLLLAHGGGLASERLAVMVGTHDGFLVAEKDLELRGPGELLGTRQSGIPELAVANLARDQALSAQAASEARRIVGADPLLELPEHRPLARALEERWEGRLSLAQVG